MGICFSSNVLAFGPEEMILDIRWLIETCTRNEDGKTRTYFGEIFGTETDNTVGDQWPSEEDGCIWLGACNPPMGFLREMSASFPDVIFELRIDADDVEYLDIYEFRRGVSVRRMHKWGPNDSSLPPSNFEAVMEMRRKLSHCVVEHLNEATDKAAQEAISDTLKFGPYYAKTVLLSLFEICDYWPEFIAKETLGIDAKGPSANKLSRFASLAWCDFIIPIAMECVTLEFDF
ncbi:hypothetical protein [Novipirellula artificiosorum]|uniref:YubB ferredoxin-like domain-containing protein n=1 Tax=Novipirellula artificiosorum TaxID=2528016 RepID=A0A5C6CG73_9BACT|nr:hypothetical protein [Novipirellula artificiosorum]TWU22554.1 hypothetical protein Poly41_71190 [Novipirellula artificiosorum]